MSEKHRNDKGITLRPHHLLCTQGYSGKGYNKAFVDNMSEIVGVLRTDPDVRVNICFTTDDLCQSCPAKLTDDVCKDDDKVLRYDAGVINILDLQEGEYRYQDLIRSLHDLLTEEKLQNICGDCQWYPVSACRNSILGGRHLMADAHQLKRVEKYEGIMQQAEEMLNDYSDEKAEALQNRIENLIDYYESPEWKQDYADDEAGRFPADMKRGVLSEDGIFDLLEKYNEMRKG